MTSETPYSHEFEIRKIAYRALHARFVRDYSLLLSLSSQPLVQRVQFLAPLLPTPNDGDSDGVASVRKLLPDAVEPYLQWQDDGSAAFLQRDWDSSSVSMLLEHSPIYYKRLDRETLYASLEFGRKERSRFVVVLMWERVSNDGQSEELYGTENAIDRGVACDASSSGWRYHNVREVVEWDDVADRWAPSLNAAEHAFSDRHAEKANEKAGESDEEYWNQYEDADKLAEATSPDGEQPYWNRHDSSDRSAITAVTAPELSVSPSSRDPPHLTSFPPLLLDGQSQVGTRTSAVRPEDVAVPASGALADGAHLRRQTTDACRVDVQPHVSDAVRAVYRLARASGMSKENFLELAWETVMECD